MMSDRRFARKATNAAGFLNRAGMQGDAIVASGRKTTAQALMMSGSGRLTGSIGGFMAGARFGAVDPSILGRPTLGPANMPAGAARPPALYAKGASRTALAGSRRAVDMARSIGIDDLSKTNASKIMHKATQAARGTAGTARGLGALGRGGALVGARAVGMAIPGVNVAMTAWMAFDIAKFLVKAPGHAAKLMSDASRSFEGGLRVGIMDQGFKDNEVTMTSRARGVQAIQNSRLNSRSILGAESGAMAAHFG